MLRMILGYSRLLKQPTELWIVGLRCFYGFPEHYLRGALFMYWNVLRTAQWSWACYFCCCMTIELHNRIKNVGMRVSEPQT